MSSTNATSHYNLSQYIGTDKPTYLVDYNGDMSKIDAGIYAAKSEADTNALNIGDPTTLTTESKSNLVSAINEVDSHTDTNTTNIGTNTTNIATALTNIGVMTNLNTTNKSSLVGAINEVNGKTDNFNLTSYTTIAENNITCNNGTLSIKDITIAKNSDGSLAKIYGSVGGYPSGASSVKITISGTGLAPESEFTINNAGLRRSHILENNTNIYIPSGVDITVKTNGNIEIDLSNTTNYVDYVIYLWPILYWIKDFGDVPINE